MDVLTETFLEGLAAQYWNVNEGLSYAYIEWPVRRRSVACAITGNGEEGITLSFAYHTSYPPTERALEFLEKYRKVMKRKLTVEGRYWLNLELTVLGRDDAEKPLTPEQLHVQAENEGAKFFQAICMYELAARASTPRTKLTKQYRDRLPELQVMLIANDHLSS